MVRILVSGILGEMGRNVVDATKNFESVQIVCGFDKKETTQDGIPVYAVVEAVTEEIDVIVDFSHPSNFSNVLALARKVCAPVVVATTNLSKEQEEEILTLSKEVAVFKSANFSYGVFVLEQLVKKATELLYNDFDIEVVETHHNRKVDAPSGTAKMLVSDIKESSSKKYETIYGRSGASCKRAKDEITVHSLRGGSVVGEHSVFYFGEDEIVEIKHTALSRRIFAVGALKGALFIQNKKCGMYDFENMLKEK